MQDKPKNLEFGDKALTAMTRGLDALADAVKVTLGPRGRNVIIERGFGSPSITKDGVSVAKEIDLKDPVENLGAQMVKDVAAKTCDEAGDGTTTATVLAQAIAKVGVRVVAHGDSPVELKRGMDVAVEDLVNALRVMAVPAQDVETIAKVGSISANNERKVGEILAEAIDRVGETGVVTVEEGNEPGISLEMVEGMELKEGMLSSAFITQENEDEINLADPVFLLVNKRIETISEIIPAIESVNRAEGKPPLVVICHGIAKPALDQVLMNVLRGTVNMVITQIPGFGDAKSNNMKDLAVSLGGMVYGNASDGGQPLKEANLADLGQAEKVRITTRNTKIFGPLGDPDKILERVRALQEAAKETPSEYEKEKILERTARLSGAMAVVYVGGHSEVEAKELRDRVEDAMHATQAAVAEGIVPGGGVALLRARAQVEANGIPDLPSKEQEEGYRIVLKAVEAPLFNIVANAGGNPSVVIGDIVSGREQGFNAHTGRYEDLLETGIIDPVKVTITALKNSVSIAGMLLTSSCAITYDRNAEQAVDINQI